MAAAEKGKSYADFLKQVSERYADDVDALSEDEDALPVPSDG